MIVSIDSVKGDLQVSECSEVDYGSLKIKGAQDCICDDDLNVKPLCNGKIHEQKRSGIKAKTLAPRLIRVNERDKPSEQFLPIVHHTVSDRFNEVTEYRPYALRDAKFYIMDESGNVGKECRGLVDL